MVNFDRAWFVAAALPVAGCLEGGDISLGEIPAPGGGISDDAASDAASEASGCVNGEAVSGERAALLSEAVGFAAEVTGGREGCMYHVTSLGDSGPGTLRDGAERAEPLWIVFDVSGQIDLTSSVDVRSNKTLDGRGQSVTVHDYGLSIVGPTSNVVVENLAFVGTGSGASNDAIHIASGSRLVWVDHCSLSHYGDGLIDVTQAATDITVSWSHFFDHDLVMLLGAGVDDTADVDIRVTLHHNYWDQTGNYAPRLRFGRAHLFNNLVARWSDGAASTTMGGQIASEANVFAAGDNVHAIRTSAGADTTPGAARSSGDLLLSGAAVEENDPDTVFHASDLYGYDAEVATSALQDEIASNAGAR